MEWYTTSERKGKGERLGGKRWWAVGLFWACDVLSVGLQVGGSVSATLSPSENIVSRISLPNSVQFLDY